MDTNETQMMVALWFLLKMLWVWVILLTSVHYVTRNAVFLVKRNECFLYIAKLLFHQSSTWHSDYIVTGLSVVTVANCQQHCDWAVNSRVLSDKGDYTVTVQSLCIQYLVGDWWDRSFTVYIVWFSQKLFLAIYRQYATMWCTQQLVNRNVVSLLAN